MAAATPSSSKISIDLPLKAGQVLEGKFRVEKIIGEGAMGLVVEAAHLVLEERVALKFLRRDARSQPEIVARFVREARAAAKIKSDHVARVYDVGSGPEGLPFIVMEYLQGRDLENILQSDGKLNPIVAVEYVIEACEGLTAAHAQGVVHRDIKPGNLFVSDAGGREQVKVLDFGISKAGISGGSFEDIDIAAAHTTQIMGSPHYMSPEQIRSTRDVDARADVWSLGVVLFELVTGETPFTATDVTGIIAQVLYEPHRSARSVAPELSEGLEKIIDRCLEKDADKRFASATELAEALLPFAPKRARALVERMSALSTRASGQSVPFDSLPPPAMSGSSTGSSLDPPAATQAIAVSTPPKKRGALAWGAMACVVLGIVGVCAALFSRMQSAPTPNLATTAPTEPLSGASAKSAAPIVAEPAPHDTASAASVASPAETAQKAATAATGRTTVIPTAKGSKAPTPKASAAGSGHADGENEIRLER